MMLTVMDRRLNDAGLLEHSNEPVAALVRPCMNLIGLRDHETDDSQVPTLISQGQQTDDYRG